MKRAFVLAAIAALTLCACKSTGYGYHDSIKLQAGGINMNGSTGVSAGYLGATIDRSANVDKNGAPIVVNPCQSNTPDTYSNLNSKATASATSVAPSSPAGAAAAAGGVQAPSIAWASGDTTANGSAARIAAAVASGQAADVLAATCPGGTLASAPAGSVVRVGVAPR